MLCVLYIKEKYTTTYDAISCQHLAFSYQSDPALKEWICRQVLFSIFNQSINQQTWKHFCPFSAENDKENQRKPETYKTQTVKEFFFSPNIWHVNIASLQFYKQMYNNASRICDGEESSSAFFFFSSLLLDGLLFFIFIFL